MFKSLWLVMSRGDFFSFSKNILVVSKITAIFAKNKDIAERKSLKFSERPK